MTSLSLEEYTELVHQCLTRIIKENKPIINQVNNEVKILMNWPTWFNELDEQLQGDIEMNLRNYYKRQVAEVMKSYNEEVAQTK